MNKYIYPKSALVSKSMPIYAVNAACEKDMQIIDRSNGTFYYSWYHTNNGDGELYINKKSYPIDSNTGFLIPPLMPHKYFPKDEFCNVDYIYLDGKMVNEIAECLGLTEFHIIKSNTFNTIHNIILNIYDSIQNLSDFEVFDSSLYCYNVLLEISKYIKNKNDNKNQLDIILNYISENFINSISLFELANLINVTPNYLCSLFKKSINMRPFEYITMLRVNHSKYLLLEKPDMDIQNISTLCGFESSNYFKDVFKKIEGISPSQFRKQLI